MKNSLLNIEDNLLDINFTFYNLLKRITQAKLNSTQRNNTLAEIQSSENPQLIELKRKLEKTSENSTDIFAVFGQRTDFLRLLEFAIQLLTVKPLILEQAKLISDNKDITIKSKHHKLSLAYDTASLGKPYYTRIAGALLSLLWFEKTNNDVDTIGTIMGDMEIAKRIRENYRDLSKSGLEANQVFMIIFNEAVNQSITSSAGGSYEERVNDILVSCGINQNDIEKGHDSKFIDMEYDHLFTYNGKRIGISSKRTLRERYKQFLHYTNDIDVDILINMTLGVDLNGQKLSNISKYGIYTVVADEIYENPSYSFVKSDNLVSRSSDFNKEFLNKITN